MRANKNMLWLALLGPIVALLAGVGTADAVVTSGLRLGVPAYVFPGQTMLNNVEASTPAVSLTILNAGDGDVAFDTTWQAEADRLRARHDAQGYSARIIGYVHTDNATRSLAAVEASVDNYLKTVGGSHVNGIFFDVVNRDCGPTAGSMTYRDYYRTLRNYVLSVQPGAMVVDNPGTAIADCYLDAANRTADTFVTFEGSSTDYMGTGWLGGNVFNSSGYRNGSEYNSDGFAFWHLIYGVPDQNTSDRVLDRAWSRMAGYVYATSDVLPNPWDVTPSWGFSEEANYASLSWSP